MDANGFDTLARTLSTRGSRSALVRLLTAVPVAGGLLTLLDQAGVAGKDDKGHKGHKGH